MIRDYFLNYETQNRDFTVTLGSGKVRGPSANHTEDGWQVTLAETGEKTMTGGRLKRVEKYVGRSSFMATYGDGVADIDIESLLAISSSPGKLATVTAVRPSSRYGELGIEDGMVTLFREKPQVNEGWINGGFFVFEPEVFRSDRGRQRYAGDRIALATGRAQTACGVSARRFLAVHGYLPRDAATRGNVGPGQGALEGVVSAG